LIFMDIHMPVMDGLEATEKIIALGIKTPIVAITANVMTNDLEYYKKNGMTDVLGKPLTSQELCSCLMKFLPIKGISSIDIQSHHNEENWNKNQLRVYFARNNQTTYQSFTDALQAGNITLAHRLIHTLKGNAGQINETQLQNAAAAAELALSDDKNLLTDEQLHVLESELDSVLKTLAPLLAETSEGDKLIITDISNIKGLLERLEPMLINYETDCMDLLDEIMRTPGMENLAQYVEAFKFKDALKELEKIKEQAGIKK